jgi:hypothetical protein
MPTALAPGYPTGAVGVLTGAPRFLAPRRPNVEGHGARDETDGSADAMVSSATVQAIDVAHPSRGCTPLEESMKKLVVVALTAALSLGFVAFAAKPADPGAGGQCVQAGIGKLKELGALQAAAQKQVDYSAFTGDDGIRLALPAGTFLSLGQVVKLHTSNPELFAWCD